MIDYEKFLKEAYAEGVSPEDFVDELQNAAKKLLEDNKVNERVTVLRQMDEDMLREEDYTYEDAASIIAIVAADEHKEWTAKDITTFRSSLLKQIPTLVNAFNIGQNLVSSVKTDFIKGKGEKPQVRVSVDSARKTADEIIDKFLRDLF